MVRSARLGGAAALSAHPFPTSRSAGARARCIGEEASGSPPRTKLGALWVTRPLYLCHRWADATVGS